MVEGGTIACLHPHTHNHANVVPSHSPGLTSHSCRVISLNSLNSRRACVALLPLWHVDCAFPLIIPPLTPMPVVAVEEDKQSALSPKKKRNGGTRNSPNSSPKMMRWDITDDVSAASGCMFNTTLKRFLFTCNLSPLPPIAISSFGAR